MADYQYLNPKQDFPYCMGCGHTMINKALDSALQKSQIAPTKINLVTDIGCVGLVDKLFLTNTIHTTHGRSTAFAMGIEMADKILFQSDAKNIIMIGDGGATIGLLHLIEAAKLNSDITVILHNNFVYGMTGGQNSGLTPEDFKTATTMSGNLSPNIHIAKLLEAAHASFISRKLATDRDLDDAILEAINHPGFALIEVVELCTGYATKWNSMTKADIERILEASDSKERGNIVKDDRESFASNYSKSFKTNNSSYPTNTITCKTKTSGDFSLDLVMAGSAGEGVQFCSKLFAKALVSQGLNISQKNDNPVTIGTGFSLTELKSSSDEILYTAIEKPDYILISSLDGYQRVKALIPQAKKIIADSSLQENFKADFSSIKLDIKFINARTSVKDPRLSNFMLLASVYNDFGDKLNYQLLIELIREQKLNSEAIISAFSSEIGTNT